jgi:hypothetical protein
MGDTLSEYMFVRYRTKEKNIRTGLGIIFFQWGSAAISNIINDIFYTKLRPVQNGIYPYQSIRVIKTFYYQILKISRSL